MPISADTERTLLNHYKLTTLHPESWPHQDNESSDDDYDEETAGGPPALNGSSRASLTKFQRIDRHASINAAPTNSESLVSKDEPDPLGVKSSVAAELKQRGLPIDENLRLRNRFMLSSTTFSPALFLSQVHQDATAETLLRGLDHLSQGIEQKSASLKVLVESNFEKFVKAKATIDNVYKEMRAQGGSDEAGSQPNSATLPGGGRRPHSRHTSRNQTHFRNASGPFSPTKALASDKKKNALTKESEYGVQGLKAPLLEVAVKAEEVWGPALGGREKEETLKAVLSTIEQHKEIFRLNGNMAESMRKNDYDSVVGLYRQAKKRAAEARNIADVAQANSAKIGDLDAQQIIITARMWHDVSLQASTFKQVVWRKLKTSHGRRPAAVADESGKEEHMELIGVLLQLGVDPEENNPIWEWLHSRYLYLKDRIARSFERSRIEIEILRRRLASSSETVEIKMLARYLRSVTNTGSLARLAVLDWNKDIDTPAILAFWEKVQSSLTSLLSSQHGVLGEVLEYWEVTHSFIDNKAQKAFPTAVFAAGLEHLELEPDDVHNLRSGTVELVNLIRETLLSFFSDPPVDDLSELYSPITSTANTPDIMSALTPGGSKRSFSFEQNNVPLPSPRNGDAWENYAFWPPQANSLSGSHFLSRILVIVGTAASEMASLSVVKQTRGGEALKLLVGTVRERCVQAVCAAWNTDAERCKVLETWTRSPDRKDLTTFPANFSAFQERLLGDMQKMAYISEATNARGSAEIIVPPPTKVLQTVRGTFVSGLYKALSGMVEVAEKLRSEGQTDADPDGVTTAKGSLVDGDAGAAAVDATNKNVRMLLTLSNLAHLRAEVIPALTTQFETNFSVKLTDESKTIRDVLSQIDARLFQSYVKSFVDKLDQIISAGISSPTWVPSAPRPTDAKPYVYDALLALVLVHSEVSTTAGSLTNQVLSYLLEQSSGSLIAAFKQRTKFSLPALMQATLDVEFLAQTLNQYTTDRAGEVQSQIYLALDERTDNDARAGLQAELPEMRAVLKKLREGTKGEFACFKRDRRGRTGTEGSGRA